MRAMLLHATGSLESNPEPLLLTDVDDPSPADDEILIRVAACGVCHTELDEIEGRTPPPKLPVIPGHEVVGRVMATGRSDYPNQVNNVLGFLFILRGAFDIRA